MGSSLENQEFPIEDLVADLGINDGVLFCCEEEGDEAAFVLTSDEVADHLKGGRIDIASAMAEISALRGDQVVTLKKVFDVRTTPPRELTTPQMTFLNGKQQLVM